MRWVEDPKGYNVGRIIIIPIINYTIHQVDLYKDRLSKKVIELAKKGKMAEIKEHSNNMDMALELSEYLKNNKEKIKCAVLGNMTSVFHLGDLIIKE